MNLINKIINEKNDIFYDFDLDLLNDTLNDFYNNEDFCLLAETNPNDFDVITLPESVPGEQLLKFIEYLYDTDKIDKNYLRKDTKPNPSKYDIKNMSYDEVLTQLTVILRGDRFCSGMLYSSIKCGTFLNLLSRLQEILTVGDKTLEKEAFENIVSEVVKKIENMEDGQSASISELVEVKPDIDLYYVFEEVDKRLRKEHIILDYSRFEDMMVGSIENLPFIKRGKKKSTKLETNKYFLKVEYTPFTKVRGRFDTEDTKPIITKINLSEIGDIKINGVVLKIIKVDDKELKFILPEGQGVSCKIAYKNRPITLRVNDRVIINSDVKDCFETWRITFLNRDVPEKQWAKCPICGTELQEYIYGETTFGLPDGKISGGCIIRRDNPSYRCPKCGIDFKKNEIVKDNNSIVSRESKTAKKLEDKDELILFKITAKDKIYDFTFGVHDQNSWLDFSIDNNPKQLYDCNLSEYLYEDFSKRIDEFTAKWQKSYKKDSEDNVNWNLCKISHGKVVKNFVGINDYPDNWNEFMDYIIMFEKISKIYSNKK